MSPFAVKNGVSGCVAVAINTSKGSQSAFKWALDNLLTNGQVVTLIYVSRTNPSGYSSEPQNKDIFLPFRCFARRKDVKCKTILLEETNVAKALIDYVSSYSIEHLVMGGSTKPNFLRFKTTEIPYTVSKEAPDFCSVYIISKGRKPYTRSATRAAPLCSKNNTNPSDHEATPTPIPSNPLRSNYSRGVGVCFPESPQNLPPDICSWTAATHHRARTSSASTMSSQSESSSTVFPQSYSPRRRQSSSECISSSNSSNRTQWLSDSTDSSLVGSPPRDNSSIYYQGGIDDGSISPPASPPGDAESKMIKRLRQELKQTMEMYNAACKEAVLAKQVAQELERSKQDEERRSKMAAEATKMAKQSNNKSEAASCRLLRTEIQRSTGIKKREKEAEEKHWGVVQSTKSNFICKQYTIEEIETATEFFSKNNKIGEGCYGPVYKGFLDNVPVAIRILHPDVAQEMSQFQQQVEALSSMRHPNMVHLLGSCPEYGCLVYEYMSRGSLEDLLFPKGRTPSLFWQSWQFRFKIAAEIASGLSFLHQTKPKPIVHRDLNPTNILINENFTSKISDVGLARLVPPNVSDSITQCQLTSTTGTFWYVDPEYQQTGKLGVKSDVYALGIMLLQLITAKPAMGITHRVQSAIENGHLAQVLDPSVPDWPLEETLSFAKLALKCSKLRRKDRPQLHQVVVPELNRLRTLAEESKHDPTSQDQVSMRLIASATSGRER